MAEQWLIDGYNLLHAAQSQGTKNDPLSREKMFALVAEFASFKKLPTLLVLDGAGEDAQLHAYRADCFEAVFSQKVSADTYIEKCLYDRRGKAQMTVVTNDRAISNIARGTGASVLSTARFFELIAECKKEADEFLQKKRSREHGFNRPFGDKLKDHE